MNVFTRIGLVKTILSWRMNWKNCPLDAMPAKVDNPKFVPARKIPSMIPDGSVVITSGMAASTRCSTFYWAIGEHFRTNGSPKNLTWIAVGGQGGRSKMPGTLEELGQKGLISNMISGHLETLKAQLKLADKGEMELHNMPQGAMCFALEAQGTGGDTVVMDTGIGTYFDPRVGRGSPVTEKASYNLIEVEGEKLKYRLPKIDVAMFTATYADAEGNIYMTDTCMTTESLESAKAAKANGGKVFVAVSKIIPKNEDEIYLAADKVDAIVVNPRSEQNVLVPQRKFWPMFTTQGDKDPLKEVEKLKFINNFMKITPYRGPVENALARLAAVRFIEVAKPGDLVNVGVGMPEEVSRLITEGGLYTDITFFNETGVFGGLPGPGIFFGSAINPKQIISSAEVFHRAYESLDVTLLGMLQMDSQGNVNVSKRGDRYLDYVGSGGFPDLTQAAKNIIFVGGAQANGKMAIEDGKVSITQKGIPKLVNMVDEVTFSGSEAVKMGKRVFYVTNLGVFRLTERGVELIEVMPGIDIQKDIIDGYPMKVQLPENGEVPVAPLAVVTGEGFSLKWRQ